MNQIPPLAWAAIIVIVLITILVNFLLIALIRSRGQMKELTRQLQTRPPSRAVQTIQQVKEAVRDPFRQEREQLSELSRLVDRLNDPIPSEKDPEDTTGNPPPVGQ